ncbi:MAG: acetate kinase [Leptospiraceae bacterium]|nr:acetate kinase [Leptospiraceae bacterium]MBK9499340.1 acetate kinase [Leptospiraceae bacterium]MBL0266088.1 acetate kinase [Leptospiraceae bacterium]MBP9165637.1 acetate kinase [Leptospiraceae bacterium]
MKILVINTGSSSIKYQLFEMNDKSVLASGLIERIGEKTAKHKFSSVNLKESIVIEKSIPDHETGISEMDELLTATKDGVIKNSSEISAIGHRVVHGGETFTKPTIIDEDVIKAIESNVPLAPLHNPGNLSGIYAAKKFFKGVPNVAVFDTAFHQTMPEGNYRYAIPNEYYEKYKIRRYGFHGTSHQYVSKLTAQFLNKPIESVNLITLHLGNGASVCSIKNGKSFDTSMGMTPLEGLIMGTRTGDLDPAIPFFMADHVKLSYKEIDTLLNKQSGLKGISALNDMRDILAKKAEGDKNAKLAIEMYVKRIRKYIGAYLVGLDGKLDAIVFTAGIGENATEIRKLCMEDLSSLGIELDENKNNASSKQVREINTEKSKIKILVCPTNEELEIAQQAKDVIEAN